jgi:tetratricopeptide (TPR) repeat protein
MDSKRFEYLMSLTSPEAVISESLLMLADAENADEKASLLISIHVSYRKLHRRPEAREVLEELNGLDIQDLGTRLNAELCKCVFPADEGRYEESLRLLADLLVRHRAALDLPEYRYLYEDTQCRRGLLLFGLDRFKEALPILQEVVLFPFDRRESKHEIHFALGTCLDETGDIEAAKQEYIRAVAMGVKNSYGEEALYRLGMLYYKIGALAQARHHLEAILRDFSDVAPTLPRSDIYKKLSNLSRHLGDQEGEKRYAALATKEFRSSR